MQSVEACAYKQQPKFSQYTLNINRLILAEFLRAYLWTPIIILFVFVDMHNSYCNSTFHIFVMVAYFTHSSVTYRFPVIHTCGVIINSAVIISNGEVKRVIFLVDTFIGRFDLLLFSSNANAYI